MNYAIDIKTRHDARLWIAPSLETANAFALAEAQRLAAIAGFHVPEAAAVGALFDWSEGDYSVEVRNLVPVEVVSHFESCRECGFPVPSVGHEESCFA